MKKIALNGKRGKGKFAKVDDDLHEALADNFSWSLTSHGYAEAWHDKLGKIVRMHRVVMGVANLDGTNLSKVDHRNGDKLDNRRDNLRMVDDNGNAQNCRPANTNSTSKYKGVRWRPDTEKWAVQVTAKGKRVSCGAYDDEMLAAKVYNTVAKELHGEYARLNEV